VFGKHHHIGIRDAEGLLEIDTDNVLVFYRKRAFPKWMTFFQHHFS
jgi:hypothetical protein